MIMTARHLIRHMLQTQGETMHPQQRAYAVLTAAPVAIALTAVKVHSRLYRTEHGQQICARGFQPFNTLGLHCSRQPCLVRCWEHQKGAWESDKLTGGAETQCKGHCSTHRSMQQHHPGATSTRGSALQDSLLLGCLGRERRIPTSKDKTHFHQEITQAGCRTAQTKGRSRRLRELLRMHASHHAMGRHALSRHPVLQPQGSAQKVHDQRGCGAWHLPCVAGVR